MRVLIADTFESSGRDGLAAAGCEVLYRPGTKDDALVAAIRETRPDVLVVRSTKVSRTMLEAGPLRLVVRAGAGFNTIDVAAASRLGIHVSNCPGKNSIAVAELAFGLVLALDRRIPDNVAALRRGEWDKGGFSKARGLFGRTLGLVGLGRIGHEMAVRARGFGMPVVAWSRSLTPERAEAIGVGFMPGPEAVAAVAEVVSVHLALEPETKRLLGPAFFSAMREGAIFVNTARSELVDSAALARAVRERKVRAGLDVFAQEPAGSAEPFSDPIVREEGVYGTHHIGASTEQAQEAIAAETVRIVREFKESGRVPNVVNLARRTPATHRLIVRHLDRPGVLATVLDTLRAAQINVQEMQNVVFEGAEAAVAYIDLDRAPAPELLERCRQENTNILDTSLLPIAGR